MDDRGFFLTRQAVRSQLAAMPHELYLVRLIHQATHRPFPGERLWTAGQLVSAATIGFLRGRNREGCDIYIQPYADNQNAGYILVDLDHPDPMVLDSMIVNGHDPCVVLQTSPGHLQAWIRLSDSPLEPVLATAAGKYLAHTYGGDLASTDWRHLGRLAGFTNRKPERRTPGGYAPWVKLVHTHVGLAPRANQLLQAARWAQPPGRPLTPASRLPGIPIVDPALDPIDAVEASAIYRDCIRRWNITQRFPHPDWSIVDLWVARYLLAQATPLPRIQAILRLASPQFPRRHGDPEDYLRRTVARAAFPSPARTVCIDDAHAPAPAASASDCSNSTGGR